MYQTSSLAYSEIEDASHTRASEFGIAKKRLVLIVVTCLSIALIGGILLYQNESARHKNLRKTIGELKQRNEELQKDFDALTLFAKSATDGARDFRLKIESLQADFTKITESSKELGELTKSFGNDYTVWDDLVPSLQAASQELASLVETYGKNMAKIEGDLAQQKKPPPPTATPNSKKQLTPPKPEKHEVEVYITSTGKKYHRDGCQYLSKSQIPSSKNDAIARGLSPCSRCSP